MSSHPRCFLPSPWLGLGLLRPVASPACALRGDGAPAVSAVPAVPPARSPSRGGPPWPSRRDPRGHGGDPRPHHAQPGEPRV